jgi:hypothetical protein
LHLETLVCICHDAQQLNEGCCAKAGLGLPFTHSLYLPSILHQCQNPFLHFILAKHFCIIEKAGNNEMI